MKPALAETERVRDALRHWREEWTAASFCLCLSGSYARGEQTSYSDMDILVLHDGVTDFSSDVSGQIVATFTKEVEHVSVTVRRTADILIMLDTDLRSWIAMMDAAYLAGSEEVYQAFRSRLQETVRSRKHDIVVRMERLIEERYLQYGNAIALLEPNIKNSAGTLRDIHAIMILSHLATMGEEEGDRTPYSAPERTISRVFVNAHRRQSVLEARTFFLAVRSAMHASSGHLHDSLDFDLQGKVARRLDYDDGKVHGSAERRKGVEAFMRDYYRHARSVRVALQLVLYDMRKASGMEQEGGSLSSSLAELPRPLTQDDLMDVFMEMARSGNTPAGNIIRSLDFSHPGRFGTASMRRFDAMLREGTHVGTTLLFMHEHGYLSAMLQEFAALEHFFQHNVYHFFTADEHTLRAIRAVETTLCDDPHTCTVLQQVEDRSVLHYAILLHDIAKPIDLQRHEHVGADMAQAILSRFGRQDIAPDVSFLVRHHLRMEQIAFRRNIREVSTLKPFVQDLGSLRRLNLLYLLTLADMSALNPGILTEWKKALLRELHAAARQMIESEETEENEALLLREDTLEVTGMEENAYSNAVQDVLDGAPYHIHFQHHRAYSEVSIFCLDRPMLLAHLSAALFGADCSIVDASIETRNDVVIDRFRLVDIFSGGHLRREQERELRELVRAVCAGETDSERMFSRFRRKWVRKLRRLPKSDVTIDVRYYPHHSDEGSEQTIIEVYAPDTFGLLYRLAAELSAFGLNVVFAKIATRVDGVVDSFYVVDQEGRAFTDESRRGALRSRILQQIAELTQ